MGRIKTGKMRKATNDTVLPDIQTQSPLHELKEVSCSQGWSDVGSRGPWGKNEPLCSAFYEGNLTVNHTAAVFLFLLLELRVYFGK